MGYNNEPIICLYLMCSTNLDSFSNPKDVLGCIEVFIFFVVAEHIRGKWGSPKLFEIVLNYICIFNFFKLYVSY